MKKSLLALVLLLTASSAFSKELTVACEKQGTPNLTTGANSTLFAQVDIANVNAAPVLRALSIKGVSQQQGRVLGKKISKEQIELVFQFGQQYYSSAAVSLQSCEDSFEATGQADLKLYVGGFAGTTLDRLNCTCELK